MKEIRTEIIIEATTTKVWEALIAFEKYKNWNPFILNIQGELQPYAKLCVTMQLEDRKPITMKPVVTVLKPEHKFEWLGKMPLGMFNGRHYFLIEKINTNQVKFTQGEYFTGWLAGFILKKIGDSTRNGFIHMNRTLKNSIEKI